MPKITALPAASAANLTDLLAKVNDPSGNEETQKLTLSQLYSLFNPVTNPNLVYAGPVSGGAATPTFRSLVLNDIPAITEAKLSIADNVTANVSTTAHGFCPKLPNDSTKFLNGVGVFAVPPSASDWTTIVVKNADQTVTNNSTLQNDSQLVIAITANTAYFVELLLLYSGNDAAGDYKGMFTFPDLTTGGVVQGYYVNYSLTLAADITSSLQNTVTTWPAGAMQLGVTADDKIHVAQARFMIRAPSSGDLQYQFANNTAGLGRTSTTRAGSTLRLKTLA